METKYGDLVNPGSGINLADVFMYYDLFRKIVEISDLTQEQQQLLNIRNISNFTEVTREDLEKSWCVLTGECNSSECDIGGCCFGLTNEATTNGTFNEQIDVSGVSVFLFEPGGKLCFNSLEITGEPTRYNLTTNDNSITGYITTLGEFDDSRVIYESKDGECYEGSINTETGFNILTKI